MDGNPPSDHTNHLSPAYSAQNSVLSTQYLACMHLHPVDSWETERTPQVPSLLWLAATLEAGEGLASLFRLEWRLGQLDTATWLLLV